MISLKTPNATATRKQLWLLHTLVKQDTRDWKLTMQEASDKISEFKLDNGRHPDYQPITGNFYELYDWLDRNGIAHMLNPEEYI